jgi:hypothetical protein
MTPHRLMICLCLGTAMASTVSAVTPVTANAGKGLVLNHLMEVGYYIEILKSESITVKPDNASLDPTHTVTGCGPVTLVTNFECQLSVRAAAASAAGGKWAATVRPSLLAKGTTQVKICVTGKDVSIGNLAAGSKMKVAQVVVTVIPH